MASAVHEITREEAQAHPVPESIVVRFAGDSGDGMQLTGGQFTLSTALAGNDLATFPDFPAEIRAPQGTLFGVSVRQHHGAAAPVEPGLYRTIIGAESNAMGLVTVAQLAGLKMFFGGYPITPASAILHYLARLKEFGRRGKRGWSTRNRMSFDDRG